MATDFELRITTPQRTSIRVPLLRQLVAIGSAPTADCCVPGLPAEWAVLDRRQGLELRLLSSGQRLRLTVGQVATVEGVAVVVQPAAVVTPTASLGELALGLASAEEPEAALATLLAWSLAHTGVDSGAVIVKEGGGYRVALARARDGSPLPHAEALLSDTIVRDVLGGGSPVCVDDLGADPRFASIESVVALDLRSCVCVPMPLGSEVVGALFLGRRDLTSPISARTTAELAMLAGMAGPLVAALRRAARAPQVEGLVGDSPAMLLVRRMVERVAPHDLGVLLAGPSGSGKEICARALHARSPRAHGPFVAVNCAAISATLLESELFGHRKGAFTGAIADRAGRFEEARGGTLFLDEIGDCPLPMQAALLRVLQERQVTRVGEGASRPVDFRLIAASHKDLPAEVAAGRFREDLLFRLRDVTIVMPALRERGDDILLLARLFLHQTEVDLRLPPRRLSPAAERVLLAHAWPGNVRELRSVIRRAAVMADDVDILPGDLGLGAAPVAATQESLDTSLPLAEARDAFINRYVQAAIARHGGDREAAAAALGISVRSLYRYL